MKIGLTIRAINILVTCFFITKSLSSQGNLVYNGGFEIMNNCPDDYTQISKATGWYACCFSPDYFRTCWGVPHTGWGFQHPASGDSYAGIGTFDVFTNREIFASELIQPMSIGTRYYLSMQVSLSEDWVLDTARFVPSNKIGMKFSTSKFVPNNMGTVTYFACQKLVNNFAHLYAEEIISDTTNWVTVQGSFVADSAYKHIAIGNFFDKANTDTISRPNAGSKHHMYVWSYFYVDDIIVSTDSTIITSVQKQKIESSVSVFPNPANDYLSLYSDLNEIHTATIFNMYGQEQQRTNFLLDSKWNIASLSEGIYFLKIESSNGTVLQKIVIKRE